MDQIASDGMSKGRRQWNTLKALLPYLWPKNETDIRFRVIMALLCLMGAKAANVVVPIFYGKTVDALTVTETALVTIPIYLLLGYGLARLMTVVFQELREAFFAKVSQRAIRKVALTIFRHLHGLSLRFHLERQTGGLSRIIERGVKGIEFLLNFTLFNILPTLVEIFLVCGILWGLFDFSFAAVTFVTIISYIAFTMWVTEWRLKYRRQMNDKDSEANTKAIDSLINYETVKYFGNEDHEAKRYDTAMQGYEKAAIRSVTSLSLVNIGQGGIIAIGLVILMAMAGHGVVNGDMTVGDFVLVNTYLIQLYLPLNFLGFVYRQIRQSLTDMEDMFTLMDVSQEIADKPNSKPLEVSSGCLSFKNVSFGYDERRPILKNVSFDIGAGKTLAIVGPSGAGKSTISRLMYRFYDSQDGEIHIDGQNIKDVQQSTLRASIGIVPQDTVLFNDTVLYNIRYGRPEATIEEVKEAAKLARIHDFIEALPDGYDSMVGERGLKLSGGEKQRVAIARTILKAPSILLFDEATSALDTATEREIQTSLRQVSEGRTTLVIAHRLSTVVDADEIIVLKAGEIAEKGKHEDLLALNGTYTEMWTRQQEAATGA